MDSTPRANLGGLIVISFESRRAKEMAELIRRYGGKPIVAPSMREVPLSENSAPFELWQKLEAGEIDLVILLTGIGTRTMVDALARQYSKERITATLASVPILARGPKPVAALKELGLQPALIAPEPNTWQEVLAILDAQVALQGKRVAVQEYGITNQELMSGLAERGAEIFRVPVYRWALPEDLRPLRKAMDEICDGNVDVVIFTSAIQVEHVFKIADQENRTDGLRRAFAHVLIASIGPVCSEALDRFGLKADFEPTHPKMGFMIGELAATAQRLLNTKREW